MVAINFEIIREKVRQGDYYVSVHASKQIRRRQLSIADIEHVIIFGEIIFHDPNANPNPKCIFLGDDAVKGESLHVVCSLNPDVQIVTIYFPDEDLWSKDRYRK